MKPGRSRTAIAARLLLVLGLLGLATVGVTYSAFSGTTANGPSSFAATTCSSPGTQTVTPDRDAGVTQLAPTTNLGTLTYIGIASGSGANGRSFLHFSLPSIPSGCSLSSAFLRTRVDQNTWSTGRTLQVFQVSASWTEAGITWNNQPATTGSAATTSSGSGWIQWDVTSLTSAQYAGTNNGLMMRDSAESNASTISQYYSSREGVAPPQLVLTFAFGTCTSPTTSTISPDRDTYVDQASSGTNFGGSTSLLVRSQSSSSNRRVLIHFTLPSIPSNCALVTATLTLYASASSSGRTLQVLQLSASWTEAGATWSNQPATTGSAVTASSGTGLVDWNVLTPVQAQISGSNNGFQLRDGTESCCASPGQTQTYFSREAASTNPLPQLALLLG